MELNGRLWKVGLIFQSRSVHISVLFRIKAGLISCNSINAHVDVLWGQPFKLIQVASNSELHENQ